MASPLVRLVLTCAFYAGVALAFAWGAWVVSQRWGPRALAIAWIAGTLAADALMAYRVNQGEAALGFPAERRHSVFLPFLPMWALGMGAAAFVIWRRQRRGETTFGRGTAASSVAAFMLGAFVFFLGVAVADISGFMGGW